MFIIISVRTLLQVTLVAQRNIIENKLVTNLII